MVGLADGDKPLRVCLTVYTQYRRVTDTQTDRHLASKQASLFAHSARYAYLSRGNLQFKAKFIIFRSRQLPKVK